MRESAAENLTRGPLQDFPITIATMRANPRQRQIAFGAFLLLVLVIAITLPFADIQLASVDAFIPVFKPSCASPISLRRCSCLPNIRSNLSLLY
jgi:hypothetical protein